MVKHAPAAVEIKHGEPFAFAGLWSRNTTARGGEWSALQVQRVLAGARWYQVAEWDRKHWRA
jgi:putative SOS response-associated peptidase YedK